MPIDSPTLTPTHEPTMTAHNGCIRTVIGKSVEIQTNTITLITIRMSSVLTTLMN